MSEHICTCGDCAVDPYEDRCRFERQLAAIRGLVDRQAQDEALWAQTQYISEAYLQQELRRLHAMIENAT